MFTFLLTHLWQSTLVLLAASVLARACRHNPAAVRHWIWFVASAKFLVPLALLQQLGTHLGRGLPEPLPVDVTLFESAGAVLVPSFPSAIAAPGLGPSPLSRIGIAIWLLGTALVFARWLLQWWSIRSRVCFGREIPGDLPVPVRIVANDLPTGVFGIVRPVVVLPRQLMQSLTPAQLSTVLAHELCHVRRCDNLTAALHQCVQALFWFYPPVWWIGSNLLREREAACDEDVIDEGHERSVYAESLLHACRLDVMARLPAVAASAGGDLHQRLSTILSDRHAEPITQQRFTLLFAAATLVCLLPLATGMVVGAFREASEQGAVTFDAITLKPPQPAWWHSTHFEPEAGRLVLKNFSILQLIEAAYPQAIVNDQTAGLGRARYDIEVLWRAEGGASERHLHRALLRHIIQTNSNLEVHVRDLHRSRRDSTAQRAQ